MDKPFYSEGLAFECQRCSACCRFEPGYVFLSKKDLRLLASHMKLTDEEFAEKYCRKIDIGGFHRLSLIEKSNHDCIFWKPEGCEVYLSRPLQCRSYPFWHPVMADAETWQDEGKHCPGIGKGKTHSPKEIDSWLSWREREPLIEG